MGTEAKTKEVTLKLRKGVFFPPWILLAAMVVVSLTNEEAFLAGLNAVTDWILNNFAWAFNLTAIGSVVTMIIVWFSPLGKVRIGGSKARPMMKYMDLVWITLCTIIAAGILFWACAEPMYHLYGPPMAAGVEAGSADAAVFAMETMYLEWSISPCAIYAVSTLTFAFVYYNMKQSFSLGSSLVPAFGVKAKKFGGIVDVICLFALVAGMAASIGTSVMSIGGGVDNVFGIESGPMSWLVITAAIMITFIISSVSGIMNGIRILSSLNGKVYFVFLLLIFLFGPTAYMLNLSVESLGAYVKDFVHLNMMNGAVYGDSWAKSWPVFYWCNWLAWTPITGVFLGKILRGYTVRDAIKCNVIIPSLFSILWIGLFSSASLYYEFDGLGLNETMLEKGAESVVYTVFEQLPLSVIIIVFYLFIIFISIVTGSDTNTNAMAGLCTYGITPDQDEAPAWLKIVWGVTLGAMTWALIAFAGIDGIKAASNLGGFPNMFLVIIMAIGLLKISVNPKKYDVHKEDYDSNGRPIESPRLPVEEKEEG
ncbi:BCCT family transporter [Mordavella massiliensis]|uniref:BCCT family transporter n=1 Tax=Mordavella massiliensis TaxID=1871024 RepID=UPI00210C4EF5|nr:BCCT family transporter [Mordavella massiliensis]